MRCDLCEHWTAPAPKDCLAFGVCGYANMLCEMTVWKKADNETTEVLKPEFADRRFAVMDGSSYHAELNTKADFFCAHFQQD